MSNSQPSAPPFLGAQTTAYPSPTYQQQQQHEPPPPYQPYPPAGPAAPLPSKVSYSSQPGYPPTVPSGYQQPSAPYPPTQPVSVYPNYQFGHQPPQPNYPQSNFQSNYNSPPPAVYQAPSASYPSGYHQPPTSNYQPGYQPPPLPIPQPSQGYGLPTHMAGMSLNSQPERAGDSLLLSSFIEGSVVVLKSCASGRTLRVLKNGQIEGKGGMGVYAQFTVHVRRPGVISLQNVQNPNYWVAIFQGNTIGTGTGDPYCDFLINEVEGQYVCLESVMSPGQYVGVLPGGQIKPPANTRTGPHGRFTVTSITSGTAAYGGIQSMFAQGNIVFLRSCASNKTLRINAAGVVQGNGGQGQFAQFIVHVRRPGVVALQNVRHPQHWLAINQGQTIGMGKGGLYCDFELKEVDGQYVCLESVMHPGQHVGILPNGSVKPPTQTGKGAHGRFVPFLHTGGTAQPQQPQRTQVPPSPLTMFAEGKVVILQSNASRRSLRITDGDVDGKGAKGAAAQFTVHTRRPGVVALQNVADPDNWLAIFQGKTIGTGKGEEYSDFKLIVTEGKFVCLESVKSAGQFVGVLPDGSVKSPTNTGTGSHGRFIPSLHH